MSIRMNGDGTQQLKRTSDLLDYRAAYTLMGWFRLNDTDDHCLFQLDDTNWFNTDASVATPGGRYVIFATSGGWQGEQGGTNTPTTGTWYHIALVRESASTYKLYVDGALEATFSNDVSGRPAPAEMTVGAQWPSLGRPLDGRVAHLKAWTTGLTLAEVRAEKPYIAPIKSASLYAWWPTKAGDSERLLDYSGNGRHWTAVGALSDEADPGIAWSPVAARRTLSPRVGSRGALCTS